MKNRTYEIKRNIKHGLFLIFFFMGCLSLNGCGESANNRQENSPQWEQMETEIETATEETSGTTVKTQENKETLDAGSLAQEENRLDEEISEETMTYLGVEGYGSIMADTVKEEGFAGYRFETSEGEKTFSIKYLEEYALQNLLEHGKSYTYEEENGQITKLTIVSTNKADSYHAPVCGRPGVRTLKNLISTALEPVGTTLYVYGGGWNWQDDGSSRMAKSYGVSESWVSFFQSQKDTYDYKSQEYYPFGKWNEYYYAGLDCSGYLGWVLYNTMTDVSDTETKGFVTSANEFAKKLATEHLLGTYSKDVKELKPGDIVSIKGHVWMSLGTCADGSILMVHSTPSPSKFGYKGGGVQLSAMAPSGADNDCEAYGLAVTYMQNYPEWINRYEVQCKDVATYLNVSEKESNGVFRFDLENVLTDPDGFAQMSPAEILVQLYGK